MTKQINHIEITIANNDFTLNRVKFDGYDSIQQAKEYLKKLESIDN